MFKDEVIKLISRINLGRLQYILPLVHVVRTPWEDEARCPERGGGGAWAGGVKC